MSISLTALKAYMSINLTMEEKSNEVERRLGARFGCKVRRPAVGGTRTDTGTRTALYEFTVAMPFAAPCAGGAVPISL